MDFPEEPSPPISSETPLKTEILDAKFERIPTSDEAQRISGGQGSSEYPGSISLNLDSKKTLEVEDEDDNELIERGSEAMKASNFIEAAECFKRAVELRVVRYGNLSPEYISAYIKYGCALASKDQAEADSFGVMSKEGDSLQNYDEGECFEIVKNDKGSAASVADGAKQDEDLSCNEGELDDGSNEEEKVEDDNEGPAENIPDLDQTRKALEAAREMISMHKHVTMQKVDIFSGLEDLASEGEDIMRFLRDNHDPLSTLECLVEPDSLRIAELNFRICLTLEIGSKPERAIPYCQKCISVCQARLQRLMDEVRRSEGSAASVVDLDTNQKVEQVLKGPQSDPSILDKKAEIGTLTHLSKELEKKLEELKQFALHPTSLSSEVLKKVSAKSRSILKTMLPVVSNSLQMGTNNSGENFNSPTVSTPDTNV